MNDARLLEVLAALPTALVEDFTLEDVMSRLGDDIADVLEVAGAGVMLEDERGRLRFVVGSDPVLGELEALQVEYDEGPCLLAYRTDEIVHAPDLTTEQRFPRFAPAALEAGMGSVFSFPLRFQDDVIGALNLYDTEPRPLGDDGDRAGRTLAGIATAYLLNARDLTTIRTENAQLAAALDRRILVEQAKGYVIARTGHDAVSAWEAIRQYARSHQRKAEDVAGEVLAGDLDPAELLGDKV